MVRKEFLTMNINDVKPYPNNPRVNDGAVADVVASIEQCENLAPIEIDENNIILSGHTRLKALKKLNYLEVEVIRYTGLSEKQKKKYRLLANKTGEKALWDDDKLKLELDDLDFEGFDFGFNGSSYNKNPYTEKINIPQYEVVGDLVSLADCYDQEKAIDLISEINEADITDEEKEFLIKAAYRHIIFDYRNIAEYYATASRKMQELMEKSALVIIDYDNAIANGYVRLLGKLKEIGYEG